MQTLCIFSFCFIAVSTKQVAYFSSHAAIEIARIDDAFVPDCFTLRHLRYQRHLPNVSRHCCESSSPPVAER